MAANNNLITTHSLYRVSFRLRQLVKVVDLNLSRVFH